MDKDRFGFPIDPSVGYARGSVLSSSSDEVKRLQQAGRVAASFVDQHGLEKIAICTGNLRFFPATSDDLGIFCEEWIGPGLFGEELRQTAIAHMGGMGHEQAAVVNRTSAGIVATILAHAQGKPILSLVPAGDRSHASVGRGAKLAGVSVIETYDLDGVKDALKQHDMHLMIVTPVTSELAMVPDDLTRDAVALGKASGLVTFLDEAYGARFRPVMHDGVPSLRLGADLVITNADKAGLSGPRAGILCGEADALIPAFSKASEMGMEARAPIALGAMRSLQKFTPELLREEVEDGKKLSSALKQILGDDKVKASALGPKIDEQDIYEITLIRAQKAHCDLVPAEITAAIGMIMLREKGIVTVNTHGQPGGRVSIRLKPTTQAVKKAGGADAIAKCLTGAIDQVSGQLDNPQWFRTLLIGDA